MRRISNDPYNLHEKRKVCINSGPKVVLQDSMLHIQASYLPPRHSLITLRFLKQVPRPLVGRCVGSAHSHLQTPASRPADSAALGTAPAMRLVEAHPVRYPGRRQRSTPLVPHRRVMNRTQAGTADERSQSGYPGPAVVRVPPPQHALHLVPVLPQKLRGRSSMPAPAGRHQVAQCSRSCCARGSAVAERPVSEPEVLP